MSKHTHTGRVLGTAIVTAALAGLAPSASAGTGLIVNGGFESGLAGWTVADQLGSDGSFSVQTGTTSPVNGLTVAAPPEGTRAAMSDGAAPGSHLLYQDFTVPTGVTSATLEFSLMVNNTATAFTTPASLDFATPALNQQARVDIITTAANPFSVSSGDVLLNAFQTSVGSSLVTGYNVFSIDVTALLAAHPGETLRLRFAETDNVNIFNFGVDRVSLVIPAPGTAMLLATGLVFMRRRRHR